MGETLEHGVHGGAANVAAGLAHGRQGYIQERSVTHVIKPDDLYIFRATQPERAQGAHQDGGGAVIGTDEGIGTVGGPDALEEGGGVGIGDVDAVRW